MTFDPNELRAKWFALREEAPGLHALELAEQLAVSECELVACVCGEEGELGSLRLDAEWSAFIRLLPKLGQVKTVTRNPNAVIEVEGTYGKIEFFGAMGQSISSIDLRIFVNRWSHGFAVREKTKRGISHGLQFFDASGRALHKLYLRPGSDHTYFESLLKAHTSLDQSQRVVVTPPSLPIAPVPNAQIDAVGLRAAWLALTDTHEFHGLLRKFGVSRTQALELAGEDLARRVPSAAFGTLLEALAKTELPFMVFVGNPGLIQIYTGPIRNVLSRGPWLNVLDPEFNLHVRADRIASAWVVRKPTADGVVTSLELYADDGEQMALFVGARKPGQRENETWRAAVERLH